MICRDTSFCTKNGWQQEEKKKKKVNHGMNMADPPPPLPFFLPDDNSSIIYDPLTTILSLASVMPSGRRKPLSAPLLTLT